MNTHIAMAQLANRNARDAENANSEVAALEARIAELEYQLKAQAEMWAVSLNEADELRSENRRLRLAADEARSNAGWAAEAARMGGYEEGNENGNGW